MPAMTSTWRNNPDPFSDGFGGPANNLFATPAAGTSTLWGNLSWEDDLIMTGVRSFDVKAYDNALGGYGDLGWGDDLRLYAPYATYSNYAFSGNTPAVPAAPPGIAGTPNADPMASARSRIDANLHHRGRHVLSDDQPDVRPRGPDAAAGRR